MMSSMFIFDISKANELVYTRDNAIDYFSSSENIYIALKIGGELSYSEFERAIDKYNDFEDKTKYKMFNEFKNGSPDVFVVLKRYRGNINVGSRFSANNLGSITELGERYILFFNDREGALYYGDCDAIEAKEVPDPYIKEVNKMMKYIANSKLTPCLYSVSYD